MKHTGVLALVDRDLIRPGHLSAEMGMKSRDAFNQRHKSDYSEMSPTSQARAADMLETARQFVQAVRDVLAGNG